MEKHRTSWGTGTIQRAGRADRDVVRRHIEAKDRLFHAELDRASTVVLATPSRDPRPLFQRVCQAVRRERGLP